MAKAKKIKPIKVKAFLVKIEPNVLKYDKKIKHKLLKMGFVKDKSPMLPTKTIWLDLRKSQERLLREMHYKTRYNIKKHQQKVKIIKGSKVNNKQLKKFLSDL